MVHFGAHGSSSRSCRTIVVLANDRRDAVVSVLEQVLLNDLIEVAELVHVEGLSFGHGSNLQQNIELEATVLLLVLIELNLVGGDAAERDAG